MRTLDSYQSLAHSIERTLRRELTPNDAAAELATSIDQLLLAQERAGELVLARLRAIVVVAALLVGVWATFIQGARPIDRLEMGGIVLRVVWAAAAVGVVLALRRGWHRPWLRYVAPAVDASMIWGGFLLFWFRGAGTDARVSPSAVAYTAALCSFLAVSGALRLSRASAQLSAALAVAVFAFASAGASLPLLPTAAIIATLLAIGALSMSVTTLVRRTVTSQASSLELSRMYHIAQREVDAREEVLKIVSHDLRNPLNTISMSAGLMLDVPLPDDQRAKHLRTIRRAGEHMNRMIQDLLDVAKLEAGRLGIVLRPTPVSRILSEAESLLRPLVEDRKIRFELLAAEGLPTINADRERVIQVLSNLVGNAIKFTPPGGRVTLRADAVGGTMRFSVADTGAGIPADQLSRIFGRFWQGDRTDRRGIGLGLAITKGIVEAHGGRIWVESRIGEGTTFHFTLAEEPPGEAQALERRESSMERRRLPAEAKAP